MISARLGELKMLHRLVVVLCLVLQSSGSARAWDSEELGTYCMAILEFEFYLVKKSVLRIPDIWFGSKSADPYL
jgi:hypothetical protein